MSAKPKRTLRIRRSTCPDLGNAQKRAESWDVVAPGAKSFAANRPGTPTRYQPDQDKRVYRLALLGMNTKQIAFALGVSYMTVANWRKRHPSFNEAIAAGRIEADAEIAESLFHRAQGYERVAHKTVMVDGEPMELEETVHYPADVKAASLWLRNRQPALWQDNKQYDHNHKGTVTHDHREIQAAEAFLGRVLDGESESLEEDLEMADEERPLLPAPVRSRKE